METSANAAILCGGRGERLKPLTDYFQKTMIPVGPKKLPILAYIVAMLKHHGITRIALLTGYRADEVKRYFGNGSELGLRISYSEDGKDSLGSLNAVVNALSSGAIPPCDELIVYYGDILTDLNVTNLLSVHVKEKADATLVLGRGYTLPVGVAEVEGRNVVSFHEKPKMDLNVTTGMMVMGPNAMALVGRMASPKKADLMKDFVPKLLKSGGKVAPFYLDQDWYDVGTVSSFEKLNKELVGHPLSELV